VSAGQTGNTRQAGNSGGHFDGKTWLLGAGSAVLSGVFLLAIEKQQWIWVAASVLAVTVTALCYSLLRTTTQRGTVLGFLAAGVALGLVLTFGVTRLLSSSKGQETSAAASNSPSEPVRSASVTPQESAADLKITFDAPAAMAKIPIGGTVATGTAEGSLGPGWTLWFVKFSDGNGGRHFVVSQIAITAGRWSARTGQIGSNDPQEVGGIFALKVVMASPEASKAMGPSAATREDGIAELPTGTKVLAEQPIVRA
jgi:hypothetical protein